MPGHYSNNPNNPYRRLASLLLAAAAMLAGCASKPEQGYGVATPSSTAAQAQQQMQTAQEASQVNTAQTYLDLIVQMQQAGQWYASLAHTEAFEQQYGPQARVRLLRADALRNTGQHQQARQAYLALLAEADATTSQAAGARRGLGLLYASQGQYAQAVAQLELARQLTPIDANVLSDLAYAHMLDGQLAPAQLPILQAAELAPGNARVQLNLALFRLANGQQAEATRLLERLSQPQAKNTPAPIDQESLRVLQLQLSTIQQAVRARAAAVAAAPIAQAAPPATAKPFMIQAGDATVPLLITRRPPKPAPAQATAIQDTAPVASPAAEDSPTDNPH
ncbi:hypothetical protein ACX12L_16625 [Alicycliphilus sp. T452]